MAKQTAWQGRESLSAGVISARIGVLFLPAVVLLVGNFRTWALGKGLPTEVWLGTVCQLLVCLFVVIRRDWRKPPGPVVLVLYLVALTLLWYGNGDHSDWYLHFSQACLLVVSMTVFALQILSESGAPAVRRARVLARRLAERKDWPDDLAACRALPEVKALREAVHLDPTPALALLLHPRPQVRIAALSALEFRKEWRRGEAELVLEAAQRSNEPVIRATAISCLANVDDRVLMEKVAGWACDPSVEVRRAATEALLWDTQHRWSWIRDAVRAALAHPLLQDDGPLLQNHQVLPPEAIKDLKAWTAEKGILGLRAAQTLAAHYNQAVNEQADDTVIEELRQQVGDPRAPAPLRLEFVQFLSRNHLFDDALQKKLLDPMNPASLRLLAAEEILDRGDSAEAVAVLREVAGLPNREIALATAGIVQRRLGVDMGLALGQPLPPLNSRTAAEVTRRVMQWAGIREEGEPTSTKTRSAHLL